MWICGRSWGKIVNGSVDPGNKPIDGDANEGCAAKGKGSHPDNAVAQRMSRPS